MEVYCSEFEATFELSLLWAPFDITSTFYIQELLDHLDTLIAN